MPDIAKLDGLRTKYFLIVLISIWNKYNTHMDYVIFIMVISLSYFVHLISMRGIAEKILFI